MVQISSCLFPLKPEQPKVRIFATFFAPFGIQQVKPKLRDCCYYNLEGWISGKALSLSNEQRTEIYIWKDDKLF